jgi:serine phosphatase RsbU (regulator of sigma subunit)
VPVNHGPVLGVFDDAERPASRFALSGTDWALLMYTDGLIEGRSGPGDKRLDITGLRDLITSAPARQLPRADLPSWLAEQAEKANEGPLADDVAMLLLTEGSRG